MTLRWLLIGLIFLTACGAPPGPEPKAPPSAPVSATPSPSPTRDAARELQSAVRQVESVLEKPQAARRCAIYFEAIGQQDVPEASRETFEAASLVKLPILAELYRRAEAGELKLSQKMVFQERFRVGGSGVIQKEAAGKAYTLEELGRLMIDVSDNVATDMLLEKLGMAAVESNAHQIGMKDTTVRRTIYDFAAIDQGRDNLISANDLAVFFRALAENKLPGSPAMRKILEGQKRNEMIPAGLPKGTKVAHKSGELTGILHDAGIVSAPRGDYILVLLGEFDDREQGVLAWKSLSSEVYKAFNR